MGIIAHMCFFVIQSLLLEMESLLVKQFVTKSDSPHMNKGKLRLFKENNLLCCDIEVSL